MLRRWKKILGIFLLSLIVLIALGVTFTIGWRPFIGPKTRALTDRKFEATSARMERGKYLAENVLGCFDCHSERDWKSPGAPTIVGKFGGGQVWVEEGMQWLVVPNITPDKETGAGAWTDDQLARAIREGIGHDGRALFPIMPYLNYHEMSDEDLASVVVYLRLIQPVRNPLPKTEIPFPLKYLIRNAPQPLISPVAPPDLSTPAKRGEYLVRLASCKDCHTPMEKGQFKAGLEYAGGFVLSAPAGAVASANITPDVSGISYYDDALFIQAMREGRVKARSLSPVMPWYFFGRMTDEDLRAMFAYLKTVKPVHHLVDNTERPTPCKVCGANHGLGERN